MDNQTKAVWLIKESNPTKAQEWLKERFPDVVCQSVNPFKATNDTFIKAIHSESENELLTKANEWFIEIREPPFPDGTLLWFNTGWE